ncbi:hypothetical protein Y1Q_0009706 [Alligator mississippiensis]|uniref:Reverse transcriptase/retrotransposon-derived protein RNase H-like domain-containing protein n=1 Tax=Alligator mississippiensis TaxID=8496 RepID=A0A151MWN6_ALLMI|nr:hypothetical protein Y1Q_0009706 [Alligator mississippiensis]
MTDASGRALGAVLLQKCGQEDHPIALASRKLSRAETRDNGHICMRCQLCSVMTQRANIWIWGRAHQPQWRCEDQVSTTHGWSCLDVLAPPAVHPPAG